MFLDTANIIEIKDAVSLGIFKGVTTNPTLLLKEGKKREVIIREILDICEGIVFVQAVGNTCEEIFNDCKRILEIDSLRIGLKIGANIEGIKAIKLIKAEKKYVPVLATAVYSVEQGMISVLAGCDYIAPYVNRMENSNINPYETVTKIRKFIDEKKADSKIIAASFKNTAQFVDILSSGAHNATISYEILRDMLDKQVVLSSIEKFNDDGFSLENIRE